MEHNTVYLWNRHQLLILISLSILRYFTMQELLGAENLFILFAVIALISLAFVVIYVPETKGLSLEEIETKILK